MEQRTSLTEIIEYINPGDLSYQEWINVGMALKQEGYSVHVWDQWSQKDISRYHARECEKKMEKLFRIRFPGDWRDNCPDGNRTGVGAGKGARTGLE